MFVRTPPVWSQPLAALTFGKWTPECQPNECVSTASSMYYQPHMGSVMALWDELLNPLFSPFSEVSCLNRLNTGAMQSLKHTPMTEPRGSGRLYTNVESTRRGRIGESTPNVRLALQSWQCKLHLTMQKEIPHDLSPPHWEVQSSKASLWTVDPTELLISLAGKWMVCLTPDEVVPLKLKDDPRKLLFSTAEVTCDREQ